MGVQAGGVLEGGNAGRKSRGTVSDGGAVVRVLAVGATPTAYTSHNLHSYSQHSHPSTTVPNTLTFTSRTPILPQHTHLKHPTPSTYTLSNPTFSIRRQ